MPPAKSQSKINPTHIQLRGSQRWVEIDDFVDANEAVAPSTATTRIRSGNRPRLAGPPRKTRANARSDSSSEDYIVPKKTGRAKKRDAPQADHSGDADTPQDGHDDTDQDSRDDADNADDANDANDTPQDGLGNPNISGITPPIPANLVEPVLAGHETHFHVVTSGTEVGIFTNRGVADARLQCKFPSSEAFSTWALAMAHYAECFVDGSIVIQSPLKPQTPINSPARKKRRPNLSACELPCSPLFFPVTPPTVKKCIADRRSLSSRTGFQDSAGQSSNTPLLPPFVSSAQPSRHVYVDDNSDDEGTYAALVRLATATPIASSTTGGAGSVRVAPNSKVVEKRSSPITVHGSDSEEYPVSDIELNNETLRLLDAPVRTVTVAPTASSSMVVERSRKFPIFVHDSDSEYVVSDIELDDDITKLLDETD